MSSVRWLKWFVAGAFLMPSTGAMGGDMRDETSLRPTYWRHNGSIMPLTANGLSREFYYEAPRQGMLVAGASPGTLLFSGYVEENAYQGIAYIFDARCGPFGYRVSGPILDGYRRVLMRGLAPRVGRDCSIVGYMPDVLEFELIGQ